MIAGTSIGISQALTFDPADVLIFDSFTGPNEQGLPAHTPDVNVIGTPWVTTDPSPAGVIRSNQLQPTGVDWDTFINGAFIEADTPDGAIGVDWHASLSGGWAE